MKLQMHHPRQGLLPVLAPTLTVLLLMLAILPLSTGFLLQPGISVQVPESPFLLAPQRNFEVVSIISPPGASLYFQNESISATELRKRLAAFKGSRKTLIVKADRNAPYGLVVEAMNEAISQGISVVLASDPSSTP